MKRFLALILLCSSLNAQSVGDLIFPKVTATGAAELYLTPTPTKILGLDGSGAPSLVSLGTGVTLPGGTLTINPDWGSITGTLADQTDLQSALNALALPTQTGNSGKFLTTNGTAASWATVSGTGDALVANPLSQFAATTSAQLIGVLTDESGTGNILTTNGSAASLTSFPTLNQSTTGNAATATALQTGRTINGVTFDGTGNITVAAAAGTLSGSTLAAGVTASSLTSVGTIAAGVWQGAAIGDTYISSATTWNAKQAGDATLTALAGAGTSGTFPYFSATDTVASATITAAGRALLDDADAAAQRNSLGLTNFLPYTPSFLWATPILANSYPIQVGNGADISVTMESTTVTWEQDTNLLGVLSATTLTDGRSWILPDASGTIALTSDLTSYLTSATAATTFQPLDAQLTSLAGIGYTGNAGKFVKVNAGETGFELATVSGSGTVTSVALSVPTGFAVTGSPITTTGTLALAYDTGYVGYTTTEASKLAGIEAAADVTDATNVAAAGAVMTSGLGTGVGAALATAVGSAGAPVVQNGAGGTPSSLTLTNATGLPTAGIVDDAVTLAKMAAGTAGNLITYDASGNPAAVATGTAGQVLTSNGAGAAPTMQTPSGGAGTTVTTIMAQHGQTLTWTDAATYFFGSQYGRTSAITSGGQCSIPIARTGTITKIALRTYSVTAGSSESWEFFIRVNNTTDTSLGTVATSANARDWNATVSIAVTAGDFIELKTVCPTWATNPANNSVIAIIYIEE